MKIIKLVVIGVFLLILILPLVFFNFQSNYFSAADNRILEDNPLDHADAYDSAAELGDAVKSYVADRIGFRSEAMAEYTYQDMFFSADRLSDFALNPAENTFDGYTVEERVLSSLTVTEEDGKSLRVITVTDLPDSTDYAYAQVGEKRYDLHKVEGGYSLTLKKDDAKPLLSELIAVDTAAAKRYRCR